MRELLRKCAIRVLKIFPARPLRIAFNLVVAVLSEHYKHRHGVLTMWGSIENLKRNGFVPGSIIDVGAYVGEWTRGVRMIYPECRSLMVEANPDRASTLQAVAETLAGGVGVRMALLGAEVRESVPFYVIGTGSSVFPEQTSFRKTPVSLPMLTLDRVAADARLESPILLKMDVQGYELEVLRGGLNVLEETEVVLLEISLMEYNQGAPLFAEVVEFLNSRGFALYDICGQHRRETDGALFQLDVIFVKKNSALRSRKRFWNDECDGIPR